MEPVEKSVFSINRLPARERYEAWRESISTIFDVEQPVRSEPDRFDAALTSYLIDDQIMVARCRTKAQLFERDSLRTARDGIDHYLIQTHLAGSQEVRRGGSHGVAGAGDLLVIDLADRHRAVTSDFTHLSLVVPRPLLAPLLAQPDSQEGRVLLAGDPLTNMAVEHLKLLARTVGHLDRDAAARAVEPAVALMASALNGSADRTENGRAAAAASLLSRAKIAIERRLHRSDLSIAHICGEVGVSRAGLYRLFEPYGGVRAYVQEARLRRTAEALMAPRSTDRHIYDIAYDWGFVSEAHFSRAFKARFGLSPRDARADGIRVDADAGPVVPPERVGDRQYENWLSETLKV